VLATLVSCMLLVSHVNQMSQNQADFFSDSISVLKSVERGRWVEGISFSTEYAVLLVIILIICNRQYTQTACIGIAYRSKHVRLSAVVFYCGSSTSVEITQVHENKTPHR